MNGLSVHALRIVAAGAGIPASALSAFRTTWAASGEAAGPDGPQNRAAGQDLVALIRAERPDLVVAEAGLATADLVHLLDEPAFQGLPLVLVVSPHDAESAGLLLDRELVLLEAPVDPGRLRATLDELAARLNQGAADAGGRYAHDDRLASLKRDADRVAAALAELAGSRPMEPVRPVTAQRIRAHVKARRQRDRFFAAELFADPVWDILLDLSAARLEGASVSISSLCIAAHVPTTTALRTIKALVDRGLLVRRVDPTDARRSFIALAPGSGQAMDACLEAVLNLPGQ